MPSPKKTLQELIHEVIATQTIHTALLSQLLGNKTPEIEPMPLKSEELKDLPATADTLPVNKAVSQAPTTIQEPEYPIPMEYREVVESVLNKEFHIKCVPLSDKPAFQFTIIVPDRYSNATQNHREMYGGDLRSKVIDYSEGTNGVRDWAEKVLNNLNPEARTAIALAREQDKR